MVKHRKGSRREEKGAFDISMGFIIIVVFAVVLLTLGITWLRGVLGGVGGLTDDLTQQASTKLQETFQQSSQNFAVWPPTWTIDRGKGIKMSAGIKNNAPDSLDHNFVINVIPIQASGDVLRNYASGCTNIDCSSAAGVSLKNFMSSWVTFIKQSFRIAKTQTGFQNVQIDVPANAPAGTYMFGVVACNTDISSGPATWDQCKSDTLTWGGSMQPVQINVK